MTKSEEKQVIRVCGKDYEKSDVPSYIRIRDRKKAQEEHLRRFPLTGVICKECGGRWIWGIKNEVNKDNFTCPDCKKWRCPECGEIRIDDARVEAGMKCGHCAYGVN